MHAITTMKNGYCYQTETTLHLLEDEIVENYACKILK